MSTASDLINRMEAECHCRIDDDDGDNFAMMALFGAMARELGKSSHSPQDDVAAGVVITHQMTPEYAEEQARAELMAKMLAAGLPPF